MTDAHPRGEETTNEEVGWAERELDSFGEYCFETDQLALKGNTDYQALLRTLVVLEGQRIIAVQNLEKLIPLKKEALENPLAFVEKLQKGEKIDFPTPQVIAEVRQLIKCNQVSWLLFLQLKHTNLFWFLY